MSRKAASVRFENVTKSYGEVVAVRDVSFTIEPGALVAAGSERVR
jgi:ABC-type multidrug transport system ATPase subunit